jgi:hypothetical protein
MKNLFVLIALLIGLTTYSCGSFRPASSPRTHLGMSFEKWDNDLVGAEGDLEVYQCRSENIYYNFRDGTLIKVDQGEMYKQRIEVEIKK